MNKNSKAALFVILLFFSAAVYYSLTLGSANTNTQTSELLNTIIWKLRFPRMLLSIFVGAALALGGVVYQALLKNHLAEPYLLGVSSGAALGAVLCAVVGSSFMAGGAFLGAVAAFLLIITFAGMSGKVSAFSLILSGVVLNSFFAALISLLISFYPRKSFGILFWLMGNLEVYNLKLLIFYSIATLFVAAIFFFLHRQLDVISLGETEAYFLGISVQKTRIFFFLISTVLIAVAVSLTGVIGYVGLIVPHFARALVGARHDKVIPVAMLLGAFFLLVGNVLIYGILQNPDVPIGVFTALLGVPFLFYIFINKKAAV